jgi:hypothetical protein
MYLYARRRARRRLAEGHETAIRHVPSKGLFLGADCRGESGPLSGFRAGKHGSISSKFHDKTVVVTNCGRLCLYRKKINLSTCLAGQAVGIKEVDEGIWLVSFMDYDLGYIDLEEKTLQPLNNPFGPKVLPMS